METKRNNFDYNREKKNVLNLVKFLLSAIYHIILYYYYIKCVINVLFLNGRSRLMFSFPIQSSFFVRLIRTMDGYFPIMTALLPSSWKLSEITT